MSKVKIGLIGLGLAFERLHSPALLRLEDKFEVTAIAERNNEKAKEAAKLLGLSESCIYDNYELMLNAADIEAVDIMVPISENYDVAKAAILSNKHIIAEKPFASTPEAAMELIRIADVNNVKVLVAENFRYEEENILIKKLLEEKKIGNTVYFIDNNISEFQKEMLGASFARTEWRQHPDFKGGIFLDAAIHHIARMRFFFGSLKSIYATGRPAETIDFCPYSSISALINFDPEGNQIAGHYNFFCLGKETQAPLVGFRIFGTNGEIYLEDKNCGFVNVSLKDGSHEAIPYKTDEGYFNELTNFYNALRFNEQIVSDPKKELGDIQTILGILRSIETGKALEVDNRN